MRRWQLKDWDELDEICFRAYGDLPGSLEAVLAANGDKLHLFDNLGRICMLDSPEFIQLPDLERPTEISKTEKIFD